jgi:hypothetical protein
LPLGVAQQKPPQAALSNQQSDIAAILILIFLRKNFFGVHLGRSHESFPSVAGFVTFTH